MNGLWEDFQCHLRFKGTIDLLTYSIASGIPVVLTIVKCWIINHQNHKHTYSHEFHDQNDRSNRCNTFYDCGDWYFSIWQSSMSQKFYWQLSDWVGPMILCLRFWRVKTDIGEKVECKTCDEDHEWQCGFDCITKAETCDGNCPNDYLFCNYNTLCRQMPFHQAT